MQTRTNPIPTVAEQAPLDLALAFAWSKRWPLLALVSLPMAVQIAVNSLLYWIPFSPANVFLLLVLVWISNGLLLCSVCMLSIESLQRKPVHLKNIIGNSFKFLPKVLFSCVVVGSLILTFALVPSSVLSVFSIFFVVFAVITAAFLIWAPAFCVGEFYAPTDEEEDYNPEEYEDELGEVRSISTRVAPSFVTMKLFTNKYLWDLGLLRSVSLSGLYWPLTIKVLMLSWLVIVLPASCAELFLGQYNEFVTDSATVIVSRILGVFVLCSWAVTFLQILPPGARKEISLPVALGAEWFEMKSGIAIEKHRRIFSVALILCIVCSWYLQTRGIARLAFPREVNAELLSTTYKVPEFTVRLKLTDDAQNFRWLLPANFVLRISPVENEKKDKKNSGNDNLIVDKYEVRAENGPVLGPDTFRPHYGPLELALYFGDAAAIPKAGKFALYYTPVREAKGRLVLKGKYQSAE